MRSWSFMLPLVSMVSMTLRMYLRMTGILRQAYRLRLALAWRHASAKRKRRTPHRVDRITSARRVLLFLGLLEDFAPERFELVEGGDRLFVLVLILVLLR